MTPDEPALEAPSSIIFITPEGSGFAKKAANILTFLTV
jgi:hypothetical protein